MIIDKNKQYRTRTETIVLREDRQYSGFYHEKQYLLRQPLQRCNDHGDD